MIRKIGGTLLLILGAVVLAGPIGFVLWALHERTAGVAPGFLSDLAYIATVGLFLLIVGLYLLTRRASKAPEDHDRR